jgi:8-amino-7-oxononanoate synthase
VATTTRESASAKEPLARHDLLSHHDPRWQGLEQLLADGLMYDAVIEEIDGRRIRIGERWLTDFASCNYLGFDLEPQIMDAITTEIHRWGTHPGWSRMLGNPRLYPQIEERLAILLRGSGPITPDVMVLPTITHIHMSVLPLLAGVGSIFLDRQSHKTIYDGCVYARGLGARLERFRDLDELRQQLRRAPVGGAAGARLVCADGVNSMTGNVPDLAALAKLCREYDATLYLDDAHGFGVLGERHPDETSPYGMLGNAVVRHLGGSYENLVLVGGFSKAYSSLLAFLTVPPGWHNLLKVAAPPYLYSGPSPTASLASVLSGMDVNQERGDTIRAELYRLSARILNHVRRLGAMTPNTLDTPIIELPLAPGRDLATVERLLWNRGIYVTMAPYPMVPREQVGFRIQVTAIHTDEQIDDLNAVLTELWDRGDLLPA